MRLPAPIRGPRFSGGLPYRLLEMEAALVVITHVAWLLRPDLGADQRAVDSAALQKQEDLLGDVKQGAPDQPGPVLGRSTRISIQSV